jgi:hypothetical protein
LYTPEGEVAVSVCGSVSLWAPAWEALASRSTTVAAILMPL